MQKNGKPGVTQPTTVPPTEPSPPVRRSPNPIRAFLVFIFRLLLLGIGGSIAFLVGMVIAQFYPAQNADEPILETLFRQSGDALQQVRRPVAPSSTESPASTPAAPVPASTSGATPLPPGIVPPSVTTANTDRLMITLPSDALFATDDPNTLRPEAQAILDSVVSDLRQYPNATIQIAAHTETPLPNADDQGSPEDRRSRSFSQAQLVERYLANRLGERYDWLVVGYGDTRSLVPNDSPLNQQRNRRIEITIEPE